MLDNVSRYTRAVNSLPVLDRAAELELARRWRHHGDEAARDVLLRTQLRYVVAIALKYRRYRQPLAELIAEGNLGLLHAVSKFDPERGNRLLTYSAYWIRAYILDSVIRSWSLVGGGSGALRSKLFFKLRRERVRITNVLGQSEEADEALARALQLPQEKLRHMLTRLEARDLSLDAQVFGDRSLRLVDTLPSLEHNQEELVASKQTGGHVRDAVRSALAVLDERERYITEQRLMADSENELSLADIARYFGISRERARQLEARAKRKLRLRIKELQRASGFELLELGSAA